MTSQMTVVSIGDLESGYYSVHLDEAPVAHPEAFTHHKLNLSLDEIQQKLSRTYRASGLKRDSGYRNGAVKDLGKTITEALREQPAVDHALTNLLNPRPESRPLFLRLDSHKAEAFPWETLWDDGAEAFVALHAFVDSHAESVPHWPLGRLVATVDAPSHVVRIVQPYLKISAIISAACVDGAAEWNALYSAVASLGNRVKLQVFVGDEKLHQAITSLQADNVIVEYAGGHDAPEHHLIAKLLGFAPNILHFFCHGSAADGSHLEIATRSDWIRRQRKGSMILDRTHLAPFGRLHSVWLITLNCCDGAAGNHELRSIARDLVDGGAPVVVAMRETIEPPAASHVTSALYSTLALELARYLPRGAKDAQRIVKVPIVTWAKAIQAARLRICSWVEPDGPPTACATHARDWAAPVLHANRAELHLRPMPSSVPGLTDIERINLRATIEKLESAVIDFSHNDDLVGAFEEQILQYESQLYHGWDP